MVFVTKVRMIHDAEYAAVTKPAIPIAYMLVHTRPSCGPLTRLPFTGHQHAHKTDIREALMSHPN
jgi:hypothetical protein